MGFCKNCGAELREEQKFCSSCGATNSRQSISEEAKDNVIKSTPDERNVDNRSNLNYEQRTVMPSKKINTKNTKFIAIIIVIALIVVGGFGYYLYLSYSANTPSGVVKKFVKAVNDKDVKVAIKCLDIGKESYIDNLLDGDLLSGAQEVMDNIKLLNYNVKVTKIVSEKIDGNNATVVVKMESKSKDKLGKTTTSDETFKLVKVKGQWKISII